MSLHTAILYGSVREARAGIRVVRYLTAALRRRGHTTAVIDAAEERLPLLDRMYKEYEHGSAPTILEALAELYRGVDAFVIVSGEYNHGIPPALKNLLDHFLEEYLFRPSAIVCYSAGQFGGVRAAMRAASAPHSFDDRASSLVLSDEFSMGRRWHAPAAAHARTIPARGRTARYGARMRGQSDLRRA